ALEGYSYATYAPGWLPDDDPHEPSHTYFGGWIPNTYLTSFWNESFATFCEDLYEREVSIGDTEERRLAFVPNMNPSPQYDEGMVATAGVMSGRSASSLGYGKGGLVLYMLEQEIGREAMQKAIQTWLTQHKNGDPGEWDQFEAIIGSDKKWFFDQWLRREGSPRYSVSNVRYVNGSVVGQVQFAGPTYRLTLDAMTVDPVGNRTMHRVSIMPEEGSQMVTFGFVVPEQPVTVSFDPYDRIMTSRSTRAPESLVSRLSRMDAIVNPNTREWARTADFNSLKISSDVPANPNGMVLVGHPDDWPGMRTLCDRAGFVVNGNSLTYDGTTIDLRHGAAGAIIEYEPGVTIGIVLGKTRRHMDTGRASVALTDELGRFLRGTTEPRMTGEFVFRF
ncbi:MAG: hypothetical protein KF812_09345, partial [Fimbriimonadaceae bacterium]|nr:hypothetical protein [Fimbriimonadaceae bacterium]